MESVQVQPVEISGWDVEGQFFVEVTEMDGNETSGSSVLLCHRVSSGTLLFVRSVADDSNPNGKGHPMPNEAQLTDSPDFAGRWHIRLTACDARNLRRAQ